jgi:hypothetical protein
MLGNNREEYIKRYLELANTLGVDIEAPTQQIEKTAEAAWAVDSYPIEPGDEPAEQSPSRGKP